MNYYPSVCLSHHAPPMLLPGYVGNVLYAYSFSMVWRVIVRDRKVTPRYFWDVATGLGEDVGKKHCTGDGGFWLLRVCVYMCVYHLRGKQSYLSVA